VLVELIAFHKMRTAMQVNAAPGSSKDLQGVEENLRRSLMRTGLFEDVEVDHTDNVNSLVIAMCKFPADMTEAQVAHRLEMLWEDNLRYGFWEAHSTLVDTGQVELEGATRHSNRGHYVTVHILAQKAPIPAQRVASE
jgi:hypothetical protein